MNIIKPPFLYRLFFPGLVWKIPVKEKVIYLTFDDGPIPEITPWVLEQLRNYNAKATFFCIGENIKKNPGIYRQIIEQGHRTGNHTFNHLKGWSVTTAEYIVNTALAAEVCKSSLFRPPYGKIKMSQAKALRNEYTIVMWDVLSYDFDKNTSPEKCLKNVTDQTSPGSIIVFHDSIKAEKNLRYALPEVLKYYSGMNYSFEIIPGKTNN